VDGGGRQKRKRKKESQSQKKKKKKELIHDTDYTGDLHNRDDARKHKGELRDSNGNDLHCAQHSTTHATWAY